MMVNADVFRNGIDPLPNLFLEPPASTLFLEPVSRSMNESRPMEAA